MGKFKVVMLTPVFIWAGMFLIIILMGIIQRCIAKKKKQAQNNQNDNNNINDKEEESTIYDEGQASMEEGKENVLYPTTYQYAYPNPYQNVTQEQNGVNCYPLDTYEQYAKSPYCLPDDS